MITKEVLFFSARMSARGGTIQRIKIWLSHLPDDVRVQCVFAAAPGHDCRRLLGLVDSGRIEFIEVDNSGVSNLWVLRWRAAKVLARRLRKSPPQVIMPITSDSDLVAFCVVWLLRLIIGRKVRIVCHCAGYPVPWHLRQKSFKGLFYKYTLRYVYRRVDKIIAISKQVKRDITDDFSVRKSKIALLPISVECAEFKNRERLERYKRSELFVFGIVSRLNEEKFIDHAIEAFSQVIKEIHARLIICGDGSEREALERLVEYLGVHPHVEFRGHTDPSYTLANIDCLVMTSQHEGTPRSILEAGCFGVPTIASNVGGIPDIIDDGKTGWLYAYGDLKALSNRMRHIAKHPTECIQAGEAMREYVMEVHAPEQEVSGLVNALFGQ